MDNGWIKLHRKSLESLIFSNEKGWKVWSWCLLKANHEGNEFFLGRTKITLKPGQFVTGKNVAHEELKMAVGTIWYWLDILESEGNIERKSTNKYSIITVRNWNKYQSVEPKMNNRLNPNRTTNEQQIEPNKNDKNVKNDKKLVLHTRGEPPVIEKTDKRNPEIQELWEHGLSLGFSNTKQNLNRFALKRLLKEKTVDQLKKASVFSQEVREQPYAPQINNWLDLEDKYLKLRDFVKRASEAPKVIKL